MLEPLANLQFLGARCRGWSHKESPAASEGRGPMRRGAEWTRLPHNHPRQTSMLLGFLASCAELSGAYPRHTHARPTSAGCTLALYRSLERVAAAQNCDVIWKLREGPRVSEIPTFPALPNSCSRGSVATVTCHMLRHMSSHKRRPIPGASAFGVIADIARVVVNVCV